MISSEIGNVPRLIDSVTQYPGFTNFCYPLSVSFSLIWALMVPRLLPQ